MNHYVYEITNLINGKKYIGKRSCHCDIEEDKYMGSGTHLKKAIKKYGIENFKKRILLTCGTESEAYKKEKETIELVRAWENSMYYNLDGGGRGSGCGERHPMYGKTHTEESRKKISENSYFKNGGKHSEKWRLNVRVLKEKYKGEGNPMYGKQSPNRRTVILLNTLEKFDSLTEAAQYVGLINSSPICNNCKGKQKTAGKINSERAKWMYYEDYLKVSSE